MRPTSSADSQRTSEGIVIGSSFTALLVRFALRGLGAGCVLVNPRNDRIHPRAPYVDRHGIVRFGALDERRQNGAVLGVHYRSLAALYSWRLAATISDMPYIIALNCTGDRLEAA